MAVHLPASAHGAHTTHRTDIAPIVSHLFLPHTPHHTPPDPKADSQELRSFIGKFGLSGELAMKPMRFLSGGQKSRAAFALLAYRKPHIVILDEPTNHLGVYVCLWLCNGVGSLY